MKTFKELKTCIDCKTDKYVTSYPNVRFYSLLHIGKLPRVLNLQKFICYRCNTSWEVREETYDKLKSETKP